MAGLKLSPKEITALQQMVHGEGAGADIDTRKMMAQSAINRLLSGRTKEFGGTMSDVLKKGYYAVKNPNAPYKQAVSGKFNDTPSKVSWGETKKIVEAVVGDKDYGKHQFYFTDEEIEKLNKGKKFDFTKVKPMGSTGKYKLFGY